MDKGTTGYDGGGREKRGSLGTPVLFSLGLLGVLLGDLHRHGLYF